MSISTKKQSSMNRFTRIKQVASASKVAGGPHGAIVTLTPGDTVYVIGVDKITLLVSLTPAD
ncbi:hypothetical protein [Microcoleus sp. PH2017_22_RUC_O_B]|uniref:hypothetical protein n=1 Tax=Microcoleus sp. PH2017_22_RUC_O_B TaxID=2798833 RepID=UPI0025D439F8|nr:hypothetical protein [Microcoleus sp. PH2017_22_RUC_O_B]